METEKPSGHKVSSEDRAYSELLLRVAVSKAAELARKGRFDEARDLLLAIAPNHDDEPVVLDLLARIAAQQGRLSEAENLWIRASYAEPSGRQYSAGLERIARMHRRPVWLGPLASLMIILVLIVGIFITSKSWTANMNSHLASLGSEVVKLKEKHDRAAGHLARFEKSMNTVLEKEIKSNPIGCLNLPGVHCKSKKDEVVVTFTSGLFERGAILKPEARPLLVSLGMRLKRYPGNISVCVIGHTNNVPIRPGSKYRDNAALALVRAITVTEYLRDTCGLPPDMFFVKGIGEYKTPYSNDTGKNRDRNKTVVIEISRPKD